MTPPSPERNVGVIVVARRLLHGHWRAMTVAMTAAALASAAALAQPLIAGRAVDEASAGAVSSRSAILLAVTFAVAIVAEASDTYLFYRLGEAVVFDRRRDYAAHLIALPVSELDRLRAGDLVARAIADTTEMQEFPRKISRVVIGTCTLAVAGTLMIRIDALLAAAVLTVVVTTFLGGSLLLAKAGAAAATRQRAVGEYGARLERTLGAIRTVKMSGAQRRHSEVIGSAAAEARRGGMRLAGLAALSAPVMRMTATGSLVVVLVVGATRVSAGAISVGELVTLFLLSLYSLAPLQDVYQGLTSMHTAAAADARIQQILTLPTETLEPSPGPLTDLPAATAVPALVEAEGLGFAHGSHRVLDGVSFTVHRNQVTALIGPSGSGKSTLLALLCRFYEPDEGRLIFDGRPYPQLALPELRRRIALVEQDNPVLHGSLRDNLAMACPDASDEDIYGALRKVNLDGFVDALPSGLDTNVLDRGRALSGGQRQRVAIARALLSPAELILLDEPTAHLDRDNLSAMIDTLIRQREHRSLIIVAHHRATLAHCDQILVVENRGMAVKRAKGNPPNDASSLGPGHREVL